MSTIRAPKVSIVTINLNNASGLEKTIESVIGQTFRDWELIVVDGGSTDGSVEWIRRHEARIARWVSEPDRGVYHAMNKGLEWIRGDYVQFLNSGDWLVDSEVLARIFGENKFKEDFLYGDVMRPHEVEGRKVWVQPDELTLACFFDQGINHQTIFYKKELFDVLGKYDEAYKIVADWDFNLRMLLAGRSTRHLPFAVAYYDWPGISADQLDRSSREKEIMLKRRLPASVYPDYERLQYLKSECRRLHNFESMLASIRSANLLFNYVRMTKWCGHKWLGRMAGRPPDPAPRQAVAPSQTEEGGLRPGGRGKTDEICPRPLPPPRLSIVTINRNNAAGLKETTESVWGQTVRDFEYIVVDGGSTDGSREFLRAHADQINRWVSEPDSGAYHAMNKGTRMAKEEWILYLNSGDTLANPGVLATVIPQLPRDADWVYGNFIWKGRGFLRQPDGLTVGRFFGDGLNHQSTFFKKTLIEELGGYDETYQIEADWDLMVRALLAGHLPRHLDATVAIYAGGGISDRQGQLREAEKDIFRKRLIPAALLPDYRRLVELERRVRRGKAAEATLQGLRQDGYGRNLLRATFWAMVRFKNRMAGLAEKATAWRRSVR